MLFVIAITLISCGKVPTEKYNTAKQCIDSLRQAGAESSLKFVALKDTMTKIDDGMERELSKLFKKYNPIRKSLDYVITESRNFVITNDRLVVVTENITPEVKNDKVIKFEVEMYFDDRQDPLKITGDAVRVLQNYFPNAKLINGKPIE